MFSRGYRLLKIAVAAVFAILSVLVWTHPSQAAGPTVAVLDFSTQGLTSDWWGQFEPGVALSDLVTDQLVNGGNFNVVDRKHLADIMQEHQLTTGGEVSPATAIASGRLTGARYLITGNILQFDKTGGSNAGAAAGSLFGHVVGGLAGGIHTERVTLKVQVRVIDAVSGVIMQSFADEQTQSGTSWTGFGGGAGGGAFGVGGYSNEQFTSSTMGHLINDEAGIIVKHIDPSKFQAAAPSGAIHGRILSVDGDDIILNIGSNRGVAVGQYFNVLSVKALKDPDSGRIINSEITKGTIQIVTVNSDSSVGKRVSGSVKALETVKSQ
jgi:curli biogenesis system outer membrane secretion channel CsgG